MRYDFIVLVALSILSCMYIKKMDDVYRDVSSLVRESRYSITDHDIRLERIEEKVCFVPQMQEDMKEILKRLERLETK